MKTTWFHNNEVLRLVYQLEGAVYGGYIRDTIAMIPPKDIDVVIPQENWIEFVRGMEELGYTEDDNLETEDASLFRKPGELNVEAIVSEDPPQSKMSGVFYIGPTAEPDFDVNLLAYDGTKLYNWMSLGMNPDLDVLTIITHIIKKEAVKFEEAAPHRVQKMISKGYTITDKKEENDEDDSDAYSPKLFGKSAVYNSTLNQMRAGTLSGYQSSSPLDDIMNCGVAPCPLPDEDTERRAAHEEDRIEAMLRREYDSDDDHGQDDSPNIYDNYDYEKDYEDDLREF